jgi:hypothetical protein
VTLIQESLRPSLMSRDVEEWRLLEERSAFIIRVTRIGELGTLAVTSNRLTLRIHAQSSSEKSVLTRATRRNIPGDAILHGQRRKNLKSYIASTGWTL